MSDGRKTVDELFVVPTQAERISAQLRQRLSAAVAAAGDALVDGDNANGAAEPEVRTEEAGPLRQSTFGLCELCRGQRAGWRGVSSSVTSRSIQGQALTLPKQMCII